MPRLNEFKATVRVCRRSSPKPQHENAPLRSSLCSIISRANLVPHQVRQSFAAANRHGIVSDTPESSYEASLLLMVDHDPDGDRCH